MASNGFERNKSNASRECQPRKRSLSEDSWCSKKMRHTFELEYLNIMSVNNHNRNMDITGILLNDTLKLNDMNYNTEFHDRPHNQKISYIAGKRIRYRISKSIIRQDEKYKEGEKDRNRIKISEKRTDFFYKSAEKERSRKRMADKRTDESYRLAENERSRIRMVEKRRDESYRCDEKERSRLRMAEKRKDDSQLKLIKFLEIKEKN